MLDTISTHLLDILQADPRLIQNGNAYTAPATTAWKGTRRPDNGTDAAAAGYVNLFDSPFEKAPFTHRPAIYLGDEVMDAMDKLIRPAINSSNGRRIEYRCLLIPLVVVVAVQGGNKAAAAHQRNQLRSNIKLILLDHLSEPGYWYKQTVPGLSGGGIAIERVSATATGAGGQDIAEGMCRIPVEIEYSYSNTSPA